MFRIKRLQQAKAAAWIECEESDYDPRLVERYVRHRAALELAENETRWLKGLGRLLMPGRQLMKRLATL